MHRNRFLLIISMLPYIKNKHNPWDWSVWLLLKTLDFFDFIPLSACWTNILFIQHRSIWPGSTWFLSQTLKNKECDHLRHNFCVSHTLAMYVFLLITHSCPSWPKAKARLVPEFQTLLWWRKKIDLESCVCIRVNCRKPSFKKS